MCFFKELVYVLLKINDCEFNIKMMIIKVKHLHENYSHTKSCMLLFLYIYILSCLIVIVSPFKVNK